MGSGPVEANIGTSLVDGSGTVLPEALHAWKGELVTLKEESIDRGTSVGQPVAASPRSGTEGGVDADESEVA